MGNVEPARPVEHWRTYGILIGAGLGALAVLVGGILDMAGVATNIAGTISGFGFVALATSVGLGHTVRLLPAIRPRIKETGRRTEVQQWQFMKAISILLNLLAVVSLAILVFAVIVRVGAFDYRANASLIVHIPNLLAMTLALVGTAAYLQSMRTKLVHETSKLATTMHISSLAGVGLSVIWGILVAWGIVGSNTDGDLVPKDHAMMYLAASLFIVLNLFIDRPLPTIYVLLSEERDVYEGHSHFKRSKSIIAPVLGAFSLLFLVFLLFVAFSGGITGLWERVRSDVTFVIVAVLIFVAVIASGIGALMLTRTPDEVAMYKEKEDKTTRFAKNLLYGSLGLASALALLALLVQQGVDAIGISQGRWTDILGLAALMALGPYGFYAGYQARRIRRMEERFPDFLRDLASSHRGGLTLPSAVTIAARGNYGPLTDEVSRMADQMSWNVSFREALQRFSERVNTPLIERAVNLILEADRSGGSTVDVLLAAARDARQIKTMENERGLSMSLYTIVVYITYGVFLLVAAVLYGQFIPEIVNATSAFGEGDISPTGQPVDTVSLGQYRAFYHTASLAQGLGSGIIAGMMGTGRAVLGLRHSFIMVGAASFVFGVFLV